jgi:outer membrane lipoprotein LolB
MPSRLRGRFASPLIAAVLAVVLAGCASLAGPSVPDADLEFELQGRIALHYGEEGGSARINWRHAPAADDLFVTNPMGQGIARITRQADDVRLVTADGKSYQARDAEALTQSVLGWRLPLAGLPDWVRGRPVPGRRAEVEKGEGGRPERIAQDDWTITYTAWQDELPSRLTLSRTGIEIRLVVDQWSKS